MLDLLTLGTAALHNANGPRGVTHVEGLIGPPGARGEFYNRPEQDGAVAPFRGYMPSRLITIEGFTKNSTIDATWTDWQSIAAQFEAALAGDVLLSWRHSGGAITLQQSVRLADQSQPILSATEQGPLLRFQVVLRAADPRWESSVLKSQSASAPSVSGGMPLPVVWPIVWGQSVSSGNVTATNAGSTTAWPIITVLGPMNNPMITCTTQTQQKFLNFDTLSLPAGNSLIVDMHPSIRTATVNGASVLGNLRWSDAQFFGLRPGVGEIINLSSGAGGADANTLLTVAWRDSYLG